MPAQAVPWPHDVALVVRRRSASRPRRTTTATALVEPADQRMARPRRRCRGCRRRRPRPVAPPNAHSRVTRSGHCDAIAIRSTASAGRLQAGQVRRSCRPQCARPCRGRRSGERLGAARVWSPGTVARLISTRCVAARTAASARIAAAVASGRSCGDALGSSECGELRHVGGGLGDLQGHLRCLEERRARARNRAARACRHVSHRHENVLEGLGVVVAEGRQACAQCPRLGGDTRAVLPCRATHARPWSRARQPLPPRPPQPFPRKARAPEPPARAGSRRGPPWAGGSAEPQELRRFRHCARRLRR